MILVAWGQMQGCEDVIVVIEQAQARFMIVGRARSGDGLQNRLQGLSVLSRTDEVTGEPCVVVFVDIRVVLEHAGAGHVERGGASMFAAGA